MILNFIVRIGFTLAAVVVGFGGTLVHAQIDIAKAYDEAVLALDEERYDDGLLITGAIINKFGTDALDKIGPVFGHFYYLHGMLNIRNQEYQAGADAFETCFTVYTNENRNRYRNNTKRDPNRFRIQSLIQWGGCLLQLKQYEESIAKYRQALVTKDQFSNTVNTLEIQVNLANAMLLSEDPSKGKEFLLSQLESKTRSDQFKRLLFLILMGDWSPKQPLSEVRSYINEYRGLLYGEPAFERYRNQNAKLHRLARLALMEEDFVRALSWYNLMVSPGDVAAEYKNRIDELSLNLVKANELTGQEDYIEQVTRVVQELSSEYGKLEAQAARMLLGIGAAHYSLGSLTGARAAYFELATRFPGISERPMVLHNLVACSVKLGRYTEAQQFATAFFDEFPDHDLKVAVGQILVEDLFFRKRYQQAFDIAAELRRELKEGTLERESPDFVYAASLYHLQRYKEAGIELASFLELYPDSRKFESVAFYQAANKVNLQDWERGAELLSQFLGDYPESKMLPSIHYLLGLCLMVLEELDKAEEHILILHKKYPDAGDVPSSYNVLGDILAAKKEEYDLIAEKYLKAKTFWETENRGNSEVGAYALQQLVARSTAEERWAEAVGYFDEFKQGYVSSPRYADVRLKAVSALARLNRADEAKEILMQAAQRTEPASLAQDEAFGRYAEFLQGNYSLENVLQALDKYPVKHVSERGWVHLGKIDALSRVESKQNQEALNKEFYALDFVFEQNGIELSNYSLIRLAAWHVEKSRGPSESARKIYQLIIDEKAEGDTLPYALIGLAKLEAQLGTAESAIKAEGLFQRILSEYQDDAMHEQAVLGIARLQFEQKNYSQSLEWWKRYRKKGRTWKTARAEASYKFGECLLNMGKRDEAAATFVNVYSNYPGQLDWSTQAYLETANIVRDKGNELDALKIVREMLQRMGHLQHPNIDKGKKIFVDWRNAYMEKQEK